MDLLEEHQKQQDAGFNQNQFSDRDVIENIFQFSEFLNFYNQKVQMQVPYNHSDEVSWPFADRSYDKFKLQNKEMKLSEFVQVFKRAMELCLSVIHPVRGFITRKIQKQKNQI